MVIRNVPVDDHSLGAIRPYYGPHNLCASSAAARASAERRNMDIGLIQIVTTPGTMRATWRSVRFRHPIVGFAVSSEEAEFLVKDCLSTDAAFSGLRSTSRVRKCHRC